MGNGHWTTASPLLAIGALAVSPGVADLPELLGFLGGARVYYYGDRHTGAAVLSTIQGRNDDK